MMMDASLSKRDINVLEKIRDPESNPLNGTIIDTSLRNDHHFRDESVYRQITQHESNIILSLQQLEAPVMEDRVATESNVVHAYRQALSDFDHLIAAYPNYASARNNRAQVLRRLYGDSMLVISPTPRDQALIQDFGDAERKHATMVALSDLDRCIVLLSAKPGIAISEKSAKTLSMAHTQRAAIYHTTSKLLTSAKVSIDPNMREARWAKVDFEEAASRDFAMGGRYGNNVAKGLAVSTNPTAKLCGQMVREAMKKEYGQVVAD